MDFESILDLNRDACSLMRVGRYRAAADLLVISLQKMQEHPTIPESCDRDLDPVGRRWHAHPVRIGWDEQEGSAYYLYNWAFEIHGDMIGSSNGILCDTRVTAILLYNAGLCYQVLGVTEGREQVCFKKALRLYALGLRLLDLNDITDRLLHLALLDNTGCILASCYEHRGTHLCLEWLQYLLATSGPFEPAQRKQVLEINLNVVLLLHRERTHAAAAA